MAHLRLFQPHRGTQSLGFPDPFDPRTLALTADLVGGKVDVISASGGNVSVRAAKSATSTIPIVFTGGDDPVATGLVASLARPGGNLTGVSLVGELNPKRLELLSELVPETRVTALLVNPNNSNADGIIRAALERRAQRECSSLY